MEYNAYNELMSYFQLEFNVYITLFAIILIGCIKMIVGYTNSRKIVDVKNTHSNKGMFDLAISLVAVLGLTSAMFFQGAMSDIPLESGHVWTNKLLYLYIASVMLFGLQLFFAVLTHMRIAKCKSV